MDYKLSYLVRRLIIILIILFATTANATLLKWDAPTNGAVDGYIVYYTNGTDSWSKMSTTHEVNLDVFNLTPGETYTFHVTAWNCMGESDPSNTVDYTMECFIPSETPKILTITLPNNVTVTVE